jgi:hypothetical protein
MSVYVRMYMTILSCLTHLWLIFYQRVRRKDGLSDFTSITALRRNVKTHNKVTTHCVLIRCKHDSLPWLLWNTCGEKKRERKQAWTRSRYSKIDNFQGVESSRRTHFVFYNFLYHLLRKNGYLQTDRQTGIGRLYECWQIADATSVMRFTMILFTPNKTSITIFSLQLSIL